MASERKDVATMSDVALVNAALDLAMRVGPALSGLVIDFYAEARVDTLKAYREELIQRLHAAQKTETRKRGE